MAHISPGVDRIPPHLSLGRLLSVLGGIRSLINAFPRPRPRERHHPSNMALTLGTPPAKSFLLVNLYCIFKIKLEIETMYQLIENTLHYYYHPLVVE